MMIDGRTEIIAHIGYPTDSFKSPLIYNPWFEQAGVNAVVVPMACRAEDYPAFLNAVFRLGNIRGALITMPHKVATVPLLDDMSPGVAVAGACNAVRRDPSGRLVGEQFDGAGFVRGLAGKGLEVAGSRALVIGCGGVGSAIVASLAGAGAASIDLFDPAAAAADALAERLGRHHPDIRIRTGRRDPAGMDLVVNASPLGMRAGDPLPVDVSRLDAHTVVGDVVLTREATAFLQAARERGCRIQPGTDMLFEQIPDYLAFFGLPTTTAARLRELARLRD